MDQLDDGRLKLAKSTFCVSPRENLFPHKVILGGGELRSCCQRSSWLHAVKSCAVDSFVFIIFQSGVDVFVFIIFLSNLQFQVELGPLVTNSNQSFHEETHHQHQQSIPRSRHGLKGRFSVVGCRRKTLGRLHGVVDHDPTTGARSSTHGIFEE